MIVWNSNCVRKYIASLLIYEILEITFLITLNATNANPPNLTLYWSNVFIQLKHWKFHERKLSFSRFWNISLTIEKDSRVKLLDREKVFRNIFHIKLHVLLIFASRPYFYKNFIASCTIHHAACALIFPCTVATARRWFLAATVPWTI